MADRQSAPPPRPGDSARSESGGVVELAEPSSVDLRDRPPYRPDMHRRRFLLTSLAGTLAVPLAAEAQQAGKVWRIGWLGDGTPAAREQNTLTPLREGLRELGYVEGKNLIIDVRWSKGSEEQLKRDAADFVRSRVDVIVTHGGL